MATTTGNNDFMVNMKLEELEALSVAELNSRIADLDKKAGSGSTDGSAKASIFSATVATRAVLKFKNFTFEAGPDTPRIAVPTTPRNTVPEKPNVDAIHDIINYNPDKVKKLSISELEGHIERLKDAQKDKHVSADLKIMIPDKIVVAEMARENQRHRHLTSQPFQREEVSGEKTRQVYLRMGWIELENAYNSRATARRDLFSRYLAIVWDHKNRMFGNTEADDDACGLIDGTVSSMGLPTIADVMQSVEDISVKVLQPGWEAATQASLKELLDTYGYENGFN